MSQPKNASKLRFDILRLCGLILVLTGAVSLILLTPSISSPAAVSAVLALMLSPVTDSLERRGFTRSSAITLLFLGGFALLALAFFWAAHTAMGEWEGLRVSAPRYFESTLAQLKQLEADLKGRYPALQSVQVTDKFDEWGKATGRWFLLNAPGFMGALFTHLLVVPLLTFALLKDGRILRKKIFEHVPNRFFETIFMVTSRISASLSDYLRAKIVEAALVGLLTALGLMAVGEPYALVLGAIAGLGNIIPYIGPVLGAVPSILVVWLDPPLRQLLLPVIGVHVVANVVDTAVIFPVVVAKLVNLHPIIMVLAVMVGGQYYGLVGMLISIPVATAVKIVFQEIRVAVQDRTPYQKAGSSGAAT